MLDKNSGFSLSYKRRLQLSLVVLLSLIEIAIIFVDISRGYISQSQRLEKRSEVLLQTHAQSLRMPLWNIDMETSQNILLSVVADPDIIGVEIEFSDNEFQLLPMSVNLPGFNQENTFKLTEKIKSPESQFQDITEIGQIKIIVTKDHLDSYLNQRLIEGLIEFIVLLIANFFIIQLIMRWLSKPLNQLSFTMSKLANNEYSIDVPWRERHDEVGEVARSVQVFKEKSIELAELHRSMEQKIAEQTRDLTIAKDAAEAATIAKSQFLATMSHEIRTPLNGVLGMAQILAETPLDKEQKENLAILSQSGKALMTIINDILDFSKLDAMQVKLEQLPFNMGQMIYDVLALSLSKDNKSKIEAILDYPPQYPTQFVGDPGRLRQVILNIVNNAIKFTPEGIVKLSVSCVKVDHGLYELEVSISDSGIGIADDAKDLLFEAFTQADQQTTRKYGGTGLGLSIVKKLVELMDGQIGFDSTLGQGSRFWVKVELPIYEGVLEGQSKSLSSNAGSPAFLSPISYEKLIDLKVLYVDDLSENCAIVERCLNFAGARVHSLQTSERVVNSLLSEHNNEQPYELLILSQNIGPQDAFALAKNIRQYESLEKLPMMLFVNPNRRIQSAEVKQSGFNAFIHKPLLNEVFLKGVLDVIERTKAEASQSDSTTTKDTFIAPQRLQASNDYPKPDKGAKVLVVEDNRINQHIAKAMLEKLDLEVDVANHGLEAIEKWKMANYDIIFMDCLMPQMDGYQATRKIRALETQQNQIIIALTANASEEDRKKCLEAGMNDVITKPFKRNDLAKGINYWLKQGGQH